MAFHFYHYYFILTLTFLLLVCTTISWDPNPAVKALCDVNENYQWCMDTLNNDWTAEYNMHDLATFAKDISEGNSSRGIQYLNETLLPNEDDVYVHEVMLTCLDSFTKVNDLLANKIDDYIFSRNYEQAKPWGIYALYVLNSCEAVCTAKQDMQCPLIFEINSTGECIKLMNDAIELIMKGVFSVT